MLAISPDGTSHDVLVGGGRTACGRKLKGVALDLRADQEPTCSDCMERRLYVIEYTANATKRAAKK